MENFKTDFEKVLKKNNLSEKEIAFKNLNAKEFSSHGFPNRKDEDWKFSDINQIIKKEIGELNFYNEQLKKSEIDKDILLNEIEHNKLFFINGQLVQTDFNYEDKGKIEFLDNQNNIDEQLADNSFLIITHYQRLLNYIKPDFVHVLMNGKVIKSGGPELALELEKKGYENIN